MTKDEVLKTITEFAIARNLKISDNCEKIVERICIREGHCPCQIEINDDTICPCIKIRTNNECCCGLFIKE